MLSVSLCALCRFSLIRVHSWTDFRLKHPDMTWIDWLAFVTGVVCVSLIVIEKDVNWPIGLLNSAALLAVFLTQKLYAQAGLQGFYIVECAYGWYMWTRRSPATGLKNLRIGKTKTTMILALVPLTAAATAILIPIFRHTGDPAPVTDSLITALSLAAEYMLCLKLLEAWGVYFVADLMSLVLLATLGQWLIFATYLCFTVLCVMGIVEWYRRWRRSPHRPPSFRGSKWSPPVTPVAEFPLSVIWGKFYPLHRGHQLLIETAMARSDRVVILLSYRDGETIPQAVRAKWLANSTRPPKPSNCPTTCPTPRKRHRPRTTSTQSGRTPASAPATDAHRTRRSPANRVTPTSPSATSRPPHPRRPIPHDHPGQRHRRPRRPPGDVGPPRPRRPRPLRENRLPLRPRVHRQVHTRRETRTRTTAPLGNPNGPAATSATATASSKTWR